MSSLILREFPLKMSPEPGETSTKRYIYITAIKSSPFSLVFAPKIEEVRLDRRRSFRGKVRRDGCYWDIVVACDRQIRGYRFIGWCLFRTGATPV